MMKSSVVLNLVCLLSVAFFVNCSTARPYQKDASSESFDQSSLLFRPRFKQPVFKPFNGFLLSWDIVRNAKVYEVQMAHTNNFQSPVKSWVVFDTRLEVTVRSSVVRWFRIRSVNSTEKSLWSHKLKIRG